MGGGRGRGEGGGGRGCAVAGHPFVAFTCFMLFTLLAGPALIIAGGVTLASLRTDVRGLAIADFRKSVQGWESDYLKGFSSRGSLYVLAKADNTQDRCGLPDPEVPGRPVIFNLTGGAMPLDTMTDARAAEEDPPLMLSNQHKFFNASLLKSSRWTTNEPECSMQVALSTSPPVDGTFPNSHLEVPVYRSAPLRCMRIEKTEESSQRSGQSTTRTTYKLESLSKLAKHLPQNAIMSHAYAALPSSQGSGGSQTEDTCARQCSNDYHGTWIPAAGGQGSLGSCTVRLVLDDLCLKVKGGVGNGTLQVDNSYPAQGPGCFWNPPRSSFASARYSMEQGSDKQTHGVDFMVRSAHDPWLMYMAKTKGTGNFGMTQAQKFMMGLILLIVGGLLCLCWVKVCYFGRKMLSPKSRPEERPAGAMQGYYYDATARYYKGPQRRSAASMAMQQMPMGMQPPAPYGQPPAPYGQPPAPYGQPPAPYGQPPAPYGQPPAPYGQPPGHFGQPPAPYGQPPAPYGQPSAPYAPPPPATGVPVPRLPSGEGYPPPDAAKTVV